MNSADENVTQTAEQIERMARILTSLCEDVLPRNRQMFALMAEGPLDEIQKLARQVEQLLAADFVETDHAETNAA